MKGFYMCMHVYVGEPDEMYRGRKKELTSVLPFGFYLNKMHQKTF